MKLMEAKDYNEVEQLARQLLEEIVSYERHLSKVNIDL